MKTYEITDETIAKLEAAGFNRWTKGRFDRLYINAVDLGLEVDYYKTGNVSSATWCGQDVSNADGRRLLATKIYVDVKTGELHVQTGFSAHFIGEEYEVETVAEAFIDAILAPEPVEADCEPFEEEQAAADYLRHLTTGGTFDPNMKDGHFAVEGREYEVAEGETVRRVNTDAEARARMVERVVAMMGGSQRPTREVKDWYDGQVAAHSLSVWERSAIRMAAIEADEPCSAAYRLSENVDDIRCGLYAAYNMDSLEISQEVRDELYDELRILRDWSEAFDAIDSDGDDLTSSAEMLATIA